MKHLYVCETCGATFEEDEEACSEHELTCTPPTVEAYEVVLSYSQEEGKWYCWVRKWHYLLHESDFPYPVVQDDCVEFEWRSRCQRTAKALKEKMAEMVAVAKAAVDTMSESLGSAVINMPEDDHEE